MFITVYPSFTAPHSRCTQFTCKKKIQHYFELKSHGTIKGRAEWVRTYGPLAGCGQPSALSSVVQPDFILHQTKTHIDCISANQKVGAIIPSYQKLRGIFQQLRYYQQGTHKTCLPCLRAFEIIQAMSRRQRWKTAKNSRPALLRLFGY